MPKKGRIVGKLKKNRIFEPLFWEPIDRRIFPSWVSKTFIEYQLTPQKLKKKIVKGKFEAMSWQKLIRDYMQNKSPYRGILLYHKLGSGKTCSAIIAAENLQRNTIVILPKSLENNFIGSPGKEGLKFCGNPMYRSPMGDKLIEKRYTFISSDAPNTLAQLKRIGSFDNHTIIIDEVHNIISMMVNEGKQGQDIYKMFMEAKNVKIMALSGTPVRNKAYEAGILFNILRGPVEILSFEASAIPDLKQLQSDLLKIKPIDYVGLDAATNNLKIHITIPSWHKDFTDSIRNIVKKSPISIKFNQTEKFTLFPEDEEEFIQYFINQKKIKDEKFKNDDLFEKRSAGLVSYFAGTGKENYPRINPTVFEDMKMSSTQFLEYTEIRKREKDFEKGPKGKSKRVLSKKK